MIRETPSVPLSAEAVAVILALRPTDVLERACFEGVPFVRSAVYADRVPKLVVPEALILGMVETGVMTTIQASCVSGRPFTVILSQAGRTLQKYHWARRNTVRKGDAEFQRWWASLSNHERMVHGEPAHAGAIAEAGPEPQGEAA